MATDCLFKITIQLKEAIEKDGRFITYINIPCGKCGRCIERRKMEWAFRMNYEMNHNSKTAYFVTLTYAPETVPYATTYYCKKTKQEEIKKQYGQKTLNPYDLEKFIKRLRQNQKRSKETIEWLKNGLQPHDKIKYYAAGEYGENFTKRPHMHLIIFNASAVNIEKSWDLGTCQVVPANEGTIAYVMKYLDKSINQKADWRKHPEYNVMSEGIGKQYIDINKSWHKQNIDILYVTTIKGIKIPMPKYYREKIFTDNERKEQVAIVTEILEEIKTDSIREIGNRAYNKKMNELTKETEKRFKKKIKKRIVD